MPAPHACPSLRQRVLPLFAFGSIVSAIRLALDAFAADWPVTMFFGTYYLMPVAIAWIGLTGRWGSIRWTTMAGTMVAVAFLVWGIWNTIAYTSGQFMEWTHGRFYPGIEVVAADGTITHERARADPIHDGALAKIGAGALHGLLSSIASSVWCSGFGTVLIWLPGRRRARV